jgi:hypothetical protein
MKHRYTVLYVVTDCSRESYDGPDAEHRQVLAATPQDAADRIGAEYSDDEDSEEMFTLVAVIAGWNKLLA